MLVKPDEVSGTLVKDLQDSILKNQVITDFLNDVRHKAVQVENTMYEPLVRRNCRLCFEYSCFE